MTALNAEIKAIRPDLLICVDHEGGRVQRFSQRRLHAPAVDAVAGRALDARCHAAPRRPRRRQGRCWPASCAPAASISALRRVLDLDYGGSSVIGNRGFHRDPRVVALLAQER